MMSFLLVVKRLIMIYKQCRIWNERRTGASFFFDLNVTQRRSADANEGKCWDAMQDVDLGKL